MQLNDLTILSNKNFEVLSFCSSSILLNTRGRVASKCHDVNYRTFTDFYMLYIQTVERDLEDGFFLRTINIKGIKK